MEYERLVRASFEELNVTFDFDLVDGPEGAALPDEEARKLTRPLNASSPAAPRAPLAPLDANTLSAATAQPPTDTTLLRARPPPSSHLVRLPSPLQLAK